MADIAKGGVSGRTAASVDRFITRWGSASGSERANYRLPQLIDTLVTLGPRKARSGRRGKRRMRPCCHH